MDAKEETGLKKWSLKRREMTRIVNRLGVVQHVGVGWCFWRVAYELKMRLGWLEKRMPCHTWPTTAKHDLRGRFWDIVHVSIGDGSIDEADRILAGRFRYFINEILDCGFPPDWFKNPYGGAMVDGNTHWSLIGDFVCGDIKGIWELGRFGFAYPLVRAYRKNGDCRYVDGFWELAENWFNKNPPNYGPHWKCGQEAAIRLMAWVFVWFAAPEGQTEERRSLLIRLAEFTGERIQKNIAYALSQKNNHGISEAAGLWTAGLLLGVDCWSRKGKALLEKQVAVLIYDDGGFSQHSCNYQRLMLDVCLWCIQLGRANGEQFSDTFVDRIRKSGMFLESLLDEKTGRVPNWGNNDGALVFPVTDCDYLDYRPVIQAVRIVTGGCRILSEGPWDEEWRWLGGRLLSEKKRPVHKQTRFPESGLIVWHGRESKMVFVCPQKFRHRPAQCDVLHVDLWVDGVNALRDGGTFSYNCGEPWQHYFKSMAAHNTVQFDGHEPMPSIGRFMYGRWVKCTVTHQEDGNSVLAEYTDGSGCTHIRLIEQTDQGWRITDHLSGYKQQAVLRWRLAPEWCWSETVNGCQSEAMEIFVTGDGGSEPRICEGWESLYYQMKQKIPVLETVLPAGSRMVVTEIKFTK